jgi:hypothetical protein
MIRMGLAVVVLLAVALAGCADAGTGGAPTPARAGASVPSASATQVVTQGPTQSATQSATPTTRTVAVPSGVTAGVAVYDRQAGAFTVQHNADQRFRSASLVKLLIAIDYLLTHQTIPAADKPRLDIMLSRSDDDAASHFYTLGGRTAVITRMNQRLGIDVVPPTAPRTGWGSTEVSAAHLVRVYRYLLDEAPPHIGQYVVGRLRHGTFTRCGTDGYDQSFGIPTAFAGQPWAAKQGWYEFANAPKTCRSATPAALTVEAAAPVDWTGEALHTTGIVGPNDRSIVVVLTVHPRGTSYATATAAVTAFTKALPLTR